VDSGAQVLSMSVGGSSFSQPLLDAVNYALNSGSIVVACMMNENNEVPYYPAGFDNVISVGALNNTDNRAV
ncbi:MAG: S8 family serine peptidase, partial [Ignavibacteriaceae bacterium]|nr:S8 family serine peptidase [Ignavibacteriaceae bacterium]